MLALTVATPLRCVFVPTKRVEEWLLYCIQDHGTWGKGFALSFTQLVCYKTGLASTTFLLNVVNSLFSPALTHNALGLTGSVYFQLARCYKSTNSRYEKGK